MVVGICSIGLRLAENHDSTLAQVASYVEDLRLASVESVRTGML